MSEYPKDDADFRDETIMSVNEERRGGWSIANSDGWSFLVPATSPVAPKEGMTVRFYPGRLGSFIRGLFIEGQQVFYRTEAEDKERREIELYGADAADWLERWDEGKTVWSIEMGGIGPGYEQCIHITCAEILRFMIDKAYDAASWSDPERAKHDTEEVRTAMFENPVVEKLGLSGAQFGAAMNLAGHFYSKGPRSVLNDEAVKDRHIQVSRIFPTV